VNPALTLFGNADSEHLAYNAWSYRRLPVITNNQAGCVVVDTNVSPMAVYVTNLAYAQSWAAKVNANAHYSAVHQAYSVGFVKTHAQLRTEKMLMAVAR
jgi:hypothetical protein